MPDTSGHSKNIDSLILGGEGGEDVTQVNSDIITQKKVFKMKQTYRENELKSRTLKLNKTGMTEVVSLTVKLFNRA